MSRMESMLDRLLKRYQCLPAQVKASVWFLICSFLQKGISTVTTPIFTRLLSATEYGQYSVFNSWYGIINIFVSLNLSAGVYTQGLVKFDKDRQKFTSSLQGFTVILICLWTAVYFLLHNFWNNLFSLTTVQMTAMLIMIWTTSVFNFWASEQRVQYKYKSLVIITLLVSLAKPIIGIAFVCNASDKVTAKILAPVLVEVLAYTWMFLVQVQKGKTFFSKTYWLYAVKYNIPLVPHYLSQMILSSADRIMIRDMVGADAAGIYSLAYSISLIMSLFNTALMQTISPWIYRKIKGKKISDIAVVAYTTLIILAALNLLLILLAPEIIAFFAPDSYYEAVYVIPPIAMSVYFMYMYDLFAKFAFYYEKTGIIMAASVAGAALNVLLNYIFIGMFDYRAAGYTTLVCYIIYSMGHYCFMNKVCDMYCGGERPYSQKKLILITFIFLSLGFAFLGLYNYPYVRFCIILLIIVIVFFKKKTIKDVVKKILDNR